MFSGIESDFIVLDLNEKVEMSCFFCQNWIYNQRTRDIQELMLREVLSPLGLLEQVL